MQFNCALAVAGVCNITSEPTFDTPLLQSTTYNYSNWRISNCSPQQTQMLINSIDDLRQEIPQVISQVTQGTETPAYRLFFKTRHTSPIISRVYSQIERGDEIPSKNEIGILVPRRPELVCVLPTGFTSYYWNRCREKGGSATSFKNQPLVILCPSFWDSLYPSQLLIQGPECPDLASMDDLPANQHMIKSKTYTILHELVHIYTRNQRRPETYALKDCAELDAAASVRNANNFVYFAASVMMRCSSWPKNLKRSLDRLNLLEARQEPDLQQTDAGIEWVTGTESNQTESTSNFTSYDIPNVDPASILSALGWI